MHVHAYEHGYTTTVHVFAQVLWVHGRSVAQGTPCYDAHQSAELNNTIANRPVATEKLQLGGSFVQSCGPFQQNTFSKIVDLLWTLNNFVVFSNKIVDMQFWQICGFFKQNSGP